MLSNRKPDHCEVQKKVCLSEAGASRRVARYDEIERYYYCPHCGHYHITSVPSNEEEVEAELVKPSVIRKRLKDLKKKVG